MKLLLSLILFITLSCSLINAINVNVKPNNVQALNNCADVLSSLNGFHSQYDILSYNGAYQNGDQVSTESFYQNGYLSVDILNQRYMAIYGINENNAQASGMTYVFAKDKVQYVVTFSGNGNQECTKIPFTSEFPFTDSYYKVTEITFGLVNSQVLTPNVTNGLQIQQLITDSQYCSPLSAQFTNLDKSTPGYTYMNFYGYSNTVISSDMELPNVCLSPSTSKVDIERVKSSLPKYLNNLF